MSYTIKEIYYTLQGEGANTGKPSVFCRFSGCNLWSGREIDRAQAICQFCDTDFVGTDGIGGGVFDTPKDVAYAIDSCWPKDINGEWEGAKLVVFTGGEPLLQLDAEIVDALHELNFSVAIETNGTKTPPKGVDWICVSPKVNAPIVLCQGDELKLVYPQADCDPSIYTSLDFQHFYLQPLDGPSQSENIILAAQYCLKHPKWQLSLQMHKMIGLP